MTADATADTRATTFEAYAHLRTFESDYDRAQGQLRTVTAAWTAAFLAFVGALLSRIYGEDAAAAAVLRPAALAACLLAVVGIYYFWRADQKVYQRLLHIPFVLGIAMEREHPWLPQVRTTLYGANLDITNSLGRFYLVFLIVFATIEVAMFAMFAGGADLVDPRRLTGLQSLEHAISAATIGWLIFACIKSVGWPNLRALIDRDPALATHLAAVRAAGSPPSH